MQDFTTITIASTDAQLTEALVNAGIAASAAEVTDDMLKDLKDALTRRRGPAQVDNGVYIITGAQKILGFYTPKEDKDTKIPSISVVLTFKREDGTPVEETLATHRFFRSIASTTGDVTNFTPYLQGTAADDLKKVFRGTPDEIVAKAANLVNRKIKLIWHECKNDAYSGIDRWLEANWVL